ncbi:MAG TPA: hypothetical protein ENH10_09140 [Bacteroidetes bacterium]|nr:hypothetical protein [Bacteroidota bacterium]HEX05299.1 hypothetical protein [Bacteroidota bacterium]
MAWRGALLEEDKTLDELLEAFFRHRQHSLKPNSIVRYRIYERNLMEFMREAFPQVTHCRQVRKIYLEECLDHLAEAGQRNSTLNGQLRFLRALFNFAIKEGYLLTSPVKNINQRRDDKKAKPNKAWTPDQVDQILETLSPHWRQIHEFLYITGMRQGEIINMTWDAVKLVVEVM